MDISSIPTLNASLNGVATLLLMAGWMAIRQGRRLLHMRLMVSALAVSALFLGFYLYYHYNAGAMTPYEKTGLIRWVYFTILITHIPLAMLVVPGCLVAVWHAVRGRFDRHVRITRWLWPVWMYVSVTGVLIYLMLYVW